MSLLRELFLPLRELFDASVNYLMPLRELFDASMIHSPTPYLCKLCGASSCRLCYDLSATNFTSQVKKLSVALTIASTTQIPVLHLC